MMKDTVALLALVNIVILPSLYFNLFLSVSKTKQKRNKVREQDLRIDEEDSIEILSEKFSLLRAAYDKIGDEMTRVRYENESLKDHQEEREEEVSHYFLKYILSD